MKQPHSKDKFLQEWLGIENVKCKDRHWEGYTQVPNLLLRYANRLGVSGSLFMLLVYLLSRDYDEKQLCYPSHKTIAIDLDNSPGSIGRGLKKLEDLHLIEIKTRISNKGQKTNVYSWNGLKKKLIELLNQDGFIK